MAARAKKSLYEVLGVPPTASTAAIKKAHRALVRTLHPDVNTAKDAAKRFAEVQHAYEVLSDPGERTKYDTSRAGAEGTNGEAVPGGTPHPHPHFTWTNVASRKQSVADKGVDDFEDIYTTFFEPRARAMNNRKR